MTELAYKNRLKSVSCILGLLVLSILMLSPATSFGEVHVLTSASLPITLSSSYNGDTVRISGSRISTSGSGISITGSNIYLDFGSDTLEFGVGSGGGNSGIQLTNNCSNITIYKGTILHRGTGSGNQCFYFTNANNFLIDSTNAVISGTNGKCIDQASSSPGVYGAEIRGGEWRSDVTAFSSRCNYDAAIMRLKNGFFDGHGIHYNIHHITITNGPSQGIMIQGRPAAADMARVRIHHNTITLDGRNDNYSYPSGTCSSGANPYSIACLSCGPGTEIYNNTITSGTSRAGSRGILIEDCEGNADTLVKVYNNTVTVHEGPNAEYAESHQFAGAYGLRMRSNDIGRIDYIEVYNNTFTAIADNNSGTTHTSMKAKALLYSDRSTTDSIHIHNNTFRAYTLNDGGITKAVLFDGVYYGNVLVFENNRIEGNVHLVKWGDYNGGAKNVTMRGDTLAFMGTTYGNTYVYYLGELSNGWDCSDNKTVDIVYENGAVQDDINFASGGTLELGLQKTLKTYIEGRNGLPVVNATVNVTNNYDNTVLTGVTDQYGYLTGAVTYRWEHRGSADSTNYNNFTIKAKMGNDSTVTSHTVSASSGIPAVILQNTDGGGDPPPDDTTPPSAIDDLGAVTGDEVGEVVLDWTAPGDDGNIGLASSYEIRYSQSNINAGNYSQATIYPTPPSPLPAGSSEELVVTSLSPGVQYFFAVRAYDDEGLISGLSNVPSALAKSNPDPGDVTPPSAIADLNAVTGEDMGEVVLDWTASGDDGNTGQAASYEIRFSLGTITSVNYSEASIYASPPSPSPAGSDQELVVTSLSPGEQYYFAIKTFDDVGLVSGLSNVSSAVSQLDFGTGDTTVGGSSPADVAPHPYPNPYNPGSGGTLSFANIPDGSSLTIMTISGSIIRQWVNTSGEVTWNGRDDSNNMVSSGVYLWYIENSDNRGKIIIRR